MYSVRGGPLGRQGWKHVPGPWTPKGTPLHVGVKDGVEQVKRVTRTTIPSSIHGNVVSTFNDTCTDSRPLYPVHYTPSAPRTVHPILTGIGPFVSKSRLNIERNGTLGRWDECPYMLLLNLRSWVCSWTRGREYGRDKRHWFCAWTTCSCADSRTKVKK